MTRKPNLGPVLAMAGAGIAVAAVIAGFILVGGPGDARERRLDGATMNRIYDVVSVAQCALGVTGAAPTSIEDARELRPAPTKETPVPLPCGGDASVHSQITTGESPAAPGDVVYRAVDATHVHVCGNFRRSFSTSDREEIYRPLSAYPQLNEAHSAGIHCYDIELIKGVDTTAEAHAGHMDAFE